MTKEEKEEEEEKNALKMSRREGGAVEEEKEDETKENRGAKICCRVKGLCPQTWFWSQLVWLPLAGGFASTRSVGNR